MNSIIADAFAIISLTLLAGLVIFTFARRDRLKTGRWWLPATLVAYMVAVGAFMVPSAWIPMSLSPIAIPFQMLALTVFCGLVASDLTRYRSRGFFGLGIAWLVIYLAASAIAPIGSEASLVGALAAFSPSAIVLVMGFAIINLLLLAMAFYIFYRNPLPEVSNRALFWVANSILILTGFSFAIIGNPFLTVIGIVVLTGGMVSTTYSQVTYRVFDVRSLIGLSFRILILITIGAVLIFGMFALQSAYELTAPVEWGILAIVAAFVIAVLYAVSREVGNFLISRLLIGNVPDAVEATKRYSQDLSKAVEISELVELSARTLNSVLRVKRSGMLLVSNSKEDGIELTVMKSSGFADVETRRVFIPANSKIYEQVVVQQETLTQFDIVFNPLYEALGEQVRTFFRQLEMSAYAPIIMDNATIGLLACSTKVNDTPLYQHDLDLLAALANQTGVALRNTRLVADLRHLNRSMQAMNQNLGSANDRMGKLDSVKTDFVTIASHELRTPLAQVRGYTDIIDALNDQGMLDQDQTRGLVGNLRKATERMEELIAAMLDVSQLDVNAMDLRFAKTSPESVLRMAIEPLTDPIKQRKLTLSARGLRGLPPIEADMQRLVQAFRNIITNSIKFTPDGGRIDIKAEFKESDVAGEPDYILVAISDTGVGIGKEHVELIFNKFYRASDPGLHSTGTYKFMGAGPGLGLTIAKGVIDGHGGEVWAESPGYDATNFPGSTFFVKLPLDPPDTARRVLPFQGEEEASNRRDTNPSAPHRLKTVK